MAIAEPIAKGDPGNAGWQRDLSASQDKIGDVLRAPGNLPGSLESYRAALAIAEHDVPDYIEADHNKMTAKLTRIPSLSDVPFPIHMEPSLVVEFYSR